MKSTDRKAVQLAFPQASSWCFLLAGFAVLMACGAKSEQDTDSKPYGTGGSVALGSGGGTYAGAGGAFSTEGVGTGGTSMTGWVVSTRALSSGGASTAGGATGDASNDDGGQANSCDLTAFALAFQKAVGESGLHRCYFSSDPATNDICGQDCGAIVLDGEGRVVSGSWTAQEMVYTLADQRWPCYANVTFLYWCSTAA